MSPFKTSLPFSVGNIITFTVTDVHAPQTVQAQILGIKEIPEPPDGKVIKYYFFLPSGLGVVKFETGSGSWSWKKTDTLQSKPILLINEP